MALSSIHYERHTLAHLTLSGRERIVAELAAQGYDERAVGELLLPQRYANDNGMPVPGIVRREEFSPREGYIPVGFVSWRSSESGRLRVPSFALPEEIASAVSPEQVAAMARDKHGDVPGRTPALAAFSALLHAWRDAFGDLGVWGSAAMEIVTGYPYTHQWSDLDIRIAPGVGMKRESLTACLAVIITHEQRYGIRIDAEVRLPDAYGISLKELLNGGATVLAKGQKHVALLQKTDVFGSLAG